MSIAIVPSVRSKPLDPEFEHLFREHSPMLYRTALSLLNNAADAEDVIQTIFLRLLRRGLPQDRPPNIKGYLYRAAVNLSLDNIRARRRRETMHDTERIPAAVEPDNSGDAEEKHRLLTEAFEELDPAAAQILILRYVHNQKDAQIAKVLGTSRGAIAMKLFRARARLKKLMRDEFGEKQ
jgi:RNA polymerase sigma factor (sigma-70 family)